jgi:16S rRNA (guanine966-N2)-methyltransferase
MSLKIHAGKARGFPLAMPRSDTSRPTSALIKRKLFDWRQNMEGYTFIDLCAGSGAVGFEALSRGAEKVFLNDSQKGAFLTLKQNAEGLIKGFQFEADSIKLTQLDSKVWVQKELKFQLEDTEDCILYIDPPYEDHKLYEDLLGSLKASGFAGEVWVESDRLKGPNREKLSGAFCSIIKVVEQGDHFVVVGKLV